LRRGRHGIADETNLVEEHEHVLQVDLAVIVEIGGEAAFIIIQKTFLAEVIRQQEKVLVVDDVVAVRSLNRALQGSSWPARELAVSRSAIAAVRRVERPRAEARAAANSSTSAVTEGMWNMA
jgi:hypothetical protein